MSQRFRHPDTLPDWLRTSLGQSLVRAEGECLSRLLNGCFGPIAVQVGEAEFGNLVAHSDAVFCYTAAMGPPASGAGSRSGLACIPEQLPFEARSLGLLVLPHVLEFSDYRHQILREAERVLMPEGQLVLLGFNPFSLWGLAGLFRYRRMPWNGRFASLSRVKDWLQLLNFELVAGKMFYHLPPVQSEGIRRRLGFLESAGDRWWPLGGAVYAVMARKREIGITPLHPQWRKRSRLGAGLAKPVARARHAAYGRTDAG
ncbi:MAG TPA: methyltransferase domain-containing protein [Arenicellales bacterium]|nr:methyltransferase domain-containing protein [Arenicellales bacterium]